MLQGVIVKHPQCSNTNVVWLGRIHDAHICRSSVFSKKMEQGVFTSRVSTMDLGKLTLPPSGTQPVYLMLPQLMKPCIS